MNSILNETFAANRTLFGARFPDLSRLLALDPEDLAERLVAEIPADYALVPAQSGLQTISVRGVFIQSRYDPARDAARAFADLFPKAKEGCVFAGMGLALVPELLAKANPDATIIIAEPDIFLFLLCLTSRPLAPLFAHRNLIFLVGTQPREVCSLIEKLSLEDLPVYENPAIMSANKPWFDEFAQLRRRNREKKEINANTLRRFGDLWLSNMSRNLPEMRDRDGIARFALAFADMPVLVLAAGPSLDRMLPYLPRLRQKCVIIAVDTAVRACVRSGVEPDFIVLVDPQYWNWRHLDGVSSPSSILITESAAWPAVFRFRCRNIFLCASLFPLGRFLEERTEKRGELGAGGSVSTTAWDFARHLGTKNILMAGLDLGFPDKKTHFTGSIFEDRTHTTSTRLSPAENAGYLALYGACPYPVRDYRGGTVLTDKRLILYAWWFESRLARYPEARTSTLTSEGVRIPGFFVAEMGEVLGLPDMRKEIDERLSRLSDAGDGRDKEAKNAKFSRALADLVDALGELDSLAKRGLSLCDAFERAAKDGRQAKALAEMDEIDRKIIMHRAKDIAAMVFADVKRDGEGAIEASRTMYRNIASASNKNLASLSNFAKELGSSTDI